MENYDPQMAERVWQRVRGESTPEKDTGIQTLAAEEQASAAALLMLSRVLQGKEKVMLRQMYEEDRSHGDCLRGIWLTVTGKPTAIRIQPPEGGDPETVLRKCYAGKLRALAEYEARCQEPEYGPVFASLARQEREHCRRILEILGRLRRIT